MPNEVNVNINININVGDADKSKTPWKNGYYYSDKNTTQLAKIDGNIIALYSVGKFVPISLTYHVFNQFQNF